jgi:hypothetical protein
MVTPYLTLRLDGAFMRLPLETRAALWLHCVDGESLAEVADTLELSPLAVERLIRGGLRDLGQFAIRCGLFLPQAEDVAALIRQLPGPRLSPGFSARLKASWERRLED